MWSQRGRAIAVFGVLALAGCSGAAAPGGVCNTEAVPDFVLFSPANGVTNVLVSISQLIVAQSFSSAQPTTITLTSSAGTIVAQAAQASGTIFFLTPPGSTPVPVPNGSVDYAAPLPTLAHATSYAVTVTYGTVNPAVACPTSFSFALGTFTTS